MSFSDSFVCRQELDCPYAKLYDCTAGNDGTKDVRGLMCEQAAKVIFHETGISVPCGNAASYILECLADGGKQKAIELIDATTSNVVDAIMRTQ